MKKLLISLLFLASFKVAAFHGGYGNASWFTVQGQCQYVMGSVARCQVCNYQGYNPIYCQVQAQGQTSYGASFNGYAQGHIMPGQCMWAEVYANNSFYDPLVFATASANCRF